MHRCRKTTTRPKLPHRPPRQRARLPHDALRPFRNRTPAPLPAAPPLHTQPLRRGQHPRLSPPLRTPHPVGLPRCRKIPPSTFHRQRPLGLRQCRPRQNGLPRRLAYEAQSGHRHRLLRLQRVVPRHPRPRQLQRRTPRLHPPHPLTKIQRLGRPKTRPRITGRLRRPLRDPRHPRRHRHQRQPRTLHRRHGRRRQHGRRPLRQPLQPDPRMVRQL